MVIKGDEDVDLVGADEIVGGGVIDAVEGTPIFGCAAQRSVTESEMFPVG